MLHLCTEHPDRVSRTQRSVRERLAEKFGWRCWYCGIRLHIGGGHTDHIIPKCIGGPDIFENYALSCPYCNRAKNAQDLDQFMSWLEWVRGGNSFSPFNMDLTAVREGIRKALGENNWIESPQPNNLIPFTN